MGGFKTKLTHSERQKKGGLYDVVWTCTFKRDLECPFKINFYRAETSSYLICREKSHIEHNHIIFSATNSQEKSIPSEINSIRFIICKRTNKLYSRMKETL